MGSQSGFGEAMARVRQREEGGEAGGRGRKRDVVGSGYWEKNGICSRFSCMTSNVKLSLPCPWEIFIKISISH